MSVKAFVLFLGLSLSLSLTAYADTPYVPTKYDNDMFHSELPDPNAPNVDTVDQANAFTRQANVMYDCVDTSLSGRKDPICADSPDAPECVGLSKALQNATTCKEYFVPASLGCKTYGTTDFDMEEWMAFGTQFDNALQGCGGSQATVNNAVADHPLQSLTDMLSYDPTTPTPTGVTIVTSGSSSTVSGSVKQEPPLKVNAFSWEEAAKKFDDGASVLGYDDGDILRKTGQGESFLDIVTESPFAQNLNEPNQKSLENGINNAGEIAENARERQKALAQMGNEPGDSGNAPKGESITPSSAGDDGHQAANKGSQADAGVTYVGETPTPGAAGPKTATPLPASERIDANANTGAGAPSAGHAAHRMTIAEKIEALQKAALAARKAGRALASLAATGESPDIKRTDEEMVGYSLFERVSLMYRKRGPSLERYEASATARDIQKMSQPEFFKGL